jgi:hypothetical protein
MLINKLINIPLLQQIPLQASINCIKNTAPVLIMISKRINYVIL